MQTDSLNCLPLLAKQKNVAVMKGVNLKHQPKRTAATIKLRRMGMENKQKENSKLFKIPLSKTTPTKLQSNDKKIKRLTAGT
jgi:hypothetical protein